MTYAISHIESLFSQMRRLAPALSVVRTDASPAHHGLPALREVTFDKVPKRDTIRLTGHAPARAGATSRLGTFFGLSAPHAEELYRLAEQLHAANPVGSWCLAPSALPNALRLSADVPNAHGFVDDVVADVFDVLPSVQSIQVVSAIQPLAQGHSRRRVFLRFRADARREVAALDTAHFAAHLDSLLVGANTHSERNVLRAQNWADQLRIDLQDLPSLLHDLSLLAVSLPTAEIQRRSAASTPIHVVTRAVG